MEYSESLPTRLNPLVAERICFSQVGAAGPLHSGAAPALPLSKEILLGLQRTAASVVLDHKQHWHLQ